MEEEVLKPYYQDSAVTIYHGDCREIVPDLGRASLLLTDPSYGINWHPRVNNRDSPWKDSERSQVDLVADYNCVWGGNYFTDQLPVSESWLIWIKRPAGFDFDGDARTYSVIEMAWSDFGGKPRMRNQ